MTNRKQRRADAKLAGGVRQRAETKGSKPIAALYRLASERHRAGDLDDAIALYEKILSQDPQHGGSLHDLGVIAYQSGRVHVALDLFLKAVEADPGSALGRYNLGSALRALDRLDEAAAAFRHAIAIEPRFFEAHVSYGNSLHALGELQGAAASFEQAVSLRPASAEAWMNLGNVLRDLGRLAEAVTAQQRGIDVKPSAIAYRNLATVFMDGGFLDETLASCRQALALDPGFHDAHDRLLFCLNFDPRLSLDALQAAHRQWAETVEDAGADTAALVAADRTPDRRLRIGYVSGDFKHHPVFYFVSGLLRSHDRSRFDIFCYDNNLQADAATADLQQDANHWRTISGLSDTEARQLIRRDEIDILIDLAGHMPLNRLGLFKRAAPVHVSWLGYVNTTGLRSMDYIIMDAETAKPGLDPCFSEAMVRLPHGRFCYTPPLDAPDIVPPPACSGQPFTFGCFNHVLKLGPQVLTLWAKVLRSVPKSRLIIKWKSMIDGPSRERIANVFLSEGIASDRVQFRGHSPHHEMLAEYNEIDVALDPFPFCGGLTSCEALWMGVPVITWPQDRPASRQTLSFLARLGLHDCVAQTDEQYVAIAEKFASNLAGLAELRAALRPRMAASPICNAPLFARSIEVAFDRMWRHHCAGQPAAPFDVAPEP